MQNAAHSNQLFLERIVQAQLESGPPVELPLVQPSQPLRSPVRHLSKLQSTLHQFVRDWAEDVGASPWCSGSWVLCRMTCVALLY